MSPQYSSKTYYLNLHCSVSPFFYVWSKRGCSHRKRSTEELKRMHGVSRCIFTSSFKFICYFKNAVVMCRMLKEQQNGYNSQRRLLYVYTEKPLVHWFCMNSWGPYLIQIFQSHLCYLLTFGFFIISYILNEHRPI